ncbi:[LysW]-aminoadipate kinase [Candidatus Acetothermia bacterium]|nr:[LysW]-aminoadipate kinase [Candidatus Acetothermia bacterium]MBI3643939.1 [LysW]-aminoadipate kinase [Candidatus Acetothermia bacterium]
MLVVKVGGSKGIDYDAFVDDLASYKDFVLIHGGSHELNELSTRLGRPPRFVTSISGQTSRYTDLETLELFNMIYAGKMNKMLVEKFQQKGINAVGLSGLDGRLAEGRQKEALKIVEDGKKKILRGDHSGTIERINVQLLHLLLENGYTPVLTPPAISFEGTAINIDGDRFAAQVAVALGAETLIILSNVPGLLRDIEDPASLVQKISRDEVELSMNQFAKGRMKKKLMGAGEALAGGVRRVVLGSATGPSPVTRALQGEGTVIE